MVTQEGLRADPEKVHGIILNPTPKSPNQIRSLFLQLAAISKFIPKIAELQYPIRKVRMRFETIEGSGWTNEAEKALQRIKRKLSKLQTFAVPKEGEQVEETPDANEGGTLNLSKKLQAKSIPTPRSWRFYLGRETIEKGSGVGIILVNLEEKMYSYAIRLKFNASNHAMNCEVLLTGLAISVSKGMKDLHIFMDSPKLVARTEGNHTPTMKQEREV
ncbi:hypothetical protein Tco_0984684 [Tanacetum coccineum]